MALLKERIVSGNCSRYNYDVGEFYFVWEEASCPRGHEDFFVL
jgi:hypothetical protein